MSILFAIQEDDAGMWCICRGQACLTIRLTLARAITEARRLARDHHERTGWLGCFRGSGQPGRHDAPRPLRSPQHRIGRNGRCLT